MTTYFPKGDITNRKWFIVDAKGQVLGKLAALTATVLSGKRKPTYTPFRDMGDHVIVINAAAVHLTGRKDSIKMYHRHTGYLGGLKSATAAEVRAKKPTKTPSAGCFPRPSWGRPCSES
jgi:large subunit ribosomal protein L13